MDIDITADIIEQVVKTMQVAVGLGVIYTVAWQDWTLRYDLSRRDFQEAI